MSTLKSSAEDLTLNADGSGNDIKFQSNAVEKASIDQDGNLVLSGTLTSVGVDDNCTATKLTVSDSGININGDITFSSASQGICLGVTSNVDANTLDDYEEGTFTPAFDSSTGGSFYNQVGKYTKVGNTVHCWGFIQTNVNPTFGDTGLVLQITGVPFAVAGVGYAGGAGSVSSQAFRYDGAYNNQSTNASSLTVGIRDSTKFQFDVTSSAGTRGEVLRTGVTNGCILTFQITYDTAA